MTARDEALTLLEGALSVLEAERAHINDLNVYPVPDGDTGTNLSLTLRAVLEEVQRTPAQDVAGAAAAAIKGSLIGARGNSGVIFSQIVRGACEVIAGAGRFDEELLRRALAEASTAAYRAVKQPVEGTMLTVIRAMAEAAAGAPAAASADRLVEIVLEAGRLAVERTTAQLDVLRQAGVVDAGGYGLLVIFGGLAAAATGGAVGSAEVRTISAPGTAAGRVLRSSHVTGIPPDGDEPSRYRYCTSLLVTGESLDRDELAGLVASLGDSWLVVGDPGMLKIHVHTDDPGAVLSFAALRGAIGAVEVADMREQTRERNARLRGRHQGTVAVAVAAGQGNKDLLRSLGCSDVIDGGQSMNPSAAQLLEAIEHVAADEVVILPNNGNVVLTAEQTVGICECNAVVVPTTSLPAGVAAMATFNPADSAVANAEVMAETARRVRSAEITHAVRDSEIDGIVVRRGQIMGLVDGRLVAGGDELLAVFRRVLAELGRGEPEVVTVLTALNGSEVTAAELEAAVAEACPGCEIDVHDGGQPLYPVLVGAE